MLCLKGWSLKKRILLNIKRVKKHLHNKRQPTAEWRVSFRIMLQHLYRRESLPIWEIYDRQLLQAQDQS